MVDAAQRERHVEPNGGYSVIVPKDWEIAKRERSPFAAFVRGDGTGDKCSIVITRSFTSDSHRTSAQRFLDARDEVEGLILHDLRINPIKTDLGIPGTCLEFQMGDDAETRSQHKLAYLEFHEIIFHVSYSCRVDAYEATVEDFYRLLKSFRIEEPEPLRADRTLYERVGGYVCNVPKDWQVDAKATFQRFVFEDDDGAKSAITVGRNPRQQEGQTIADVAEKRLVKLRTLFADLEILHEESFADGSGGEGRRVVAQATNGNDELIRMVLFFFSGDEEGTLECGGFTAAYNEENFDVTFDAFARNLKLAAKSPANSTDARAVAPSRKQRTPENK